MNSNNIFPTRIYQKIFDTSREIIICLNRKGIVIATNSKTSKLINVDRNKIVGKDWINKFVNDEDRVKVQNLFNTLVNDNKNIESEEFRSKIRSTEGKTYDISWKYSVTPVETDDETFLIAFGTDITDVRNLKKFADDMALFPHENPNPVFRIDRNGDVLVANNATNELLNDLAHSDTSDNINGKYGWKNLVYVASKLSHRERLELRTGDKTYSFDVNPVKGKDYINLYGSDITQLRNTEAELQDMSFHDHLTHTANRKLFLLNLQQSFDTYRRDKTKFALLTFDLENFHSINDVLGHMSGDLVLIQVADRIKKIIRKTDVIARFGGDEFIIIQNKVKTKKDVRALVTKILKTFEDDFEVINKKIKVSTSIGITVVGARTKNKDQMLEQADIASQLSRENPNIDYVFYEPKTGKNIHSDMAISREITHALTNNEFFLVYQPQHRLSDNKVIGCEALIRWRDPKIGIVSPGVFIPVAEKYGLIKQVGIWVIDEVIRQLVEWKKNNIKVPRISINIASQQMAEPGFAEDLINKLQINNLPAASIECEILESSYLGIDDVVNNNMKLLGSMGIELALDDFGTGYSSLSYLHNLPLTTIKLAQELVKDMDKIPKHASLVAAAISMAESMHFKTIAEGVETEEIEKQLIKLHCDISQGYFHSKPIEPDELVKYLAANAVD